MLDRIMYMEYSHCIEIAKKTKQSKFSLRYLEQIEIIGERMRNVLNNVMDTEDYINWCENSEDAKAYEKKLNDIICAEKMRLKLTDDSETEAIKANLQACIKLKRLFNLYV